MNFEEQVLQFIEKNGLTAPRGTILIGVSGGADSMALLVSLAALRHKLGVQLHAAHFNHRLRFDAIRDERFVENWCRQLNVPVAIGRRPGRGLKHLSEDEAREMRFAFFLQTAKHLKARAVALAHTRNDLAETVLMRLMRGSGLYGLRAIQPQRTIEGVNFIRPLMGLDRRDIENYLKVKKIPFCTDATNRRMVYERNKVRHKLLPLLAREYNPQIIDALVGLAATAGEDYGFLQAQADRQFKKMVSIHGKKVKMKLTPARRQPVSILRLILRQMTEVFTGDVAALSFEHIHALEALVAQKTEGRLDLPQRIRAVRSDQFLELSYA